MLTTLVLCSCDFLKAQLLYWVLIKQLFKQFYEITILRSSIAFPFTVYNITN
jgi:hypothetical protein